jgi:SAM-dependent methyltransferase
MKAFGSYSEYYDLLYVDKDYLGEVSFVEDLIEKYAPGAKTILDLGCGTGRHALYLAEKYSMTGVDQSEDMLKKARAIRDAGEGRTSSLDFHHGDIRSFRLNKQFDTVISLFHVMSYQTTDDDLAAAFRTARIHLKPGGVFIFDCWYGPAVLTDRPVVRTKRLENDRIELVRTAEPVLYPNENTVAVKYRMEVREKGSTKVEEIIETHKMRYWFMPEIVSKLRNGGFEVFETGEWMTRKQPGFESWSVYFVAENTESGNG